MSFLRSRPLWQWIFFSLIAGALLGMLLGEKAEFLKPIGDMFIRLMTMLIVPLVASMIFTAVVSLNNMASLGRFGGFVILFFLGTTAFSVLVGILFMETFRPGLAAAALFSDLATIDDATKKMADATVVDRLFGLVPSNPFAAFGRANLIQVIFFMLLLGVAALKIGPKADSFVHAVNSFTEIMHAMVDYVIVLAPIGVFAIMASVTGSFGVESLVPLLKLVLLMHVAVGVVMVVQYCLVALFSQLSVKRFAASIFEAQVLGYATCSSSATLPVTERCLSQKLGLPKRVVDFVLPIGAVCNMNGSAVYHTMAATFVAQALGVPFDLSAYLSLVFVVVIASVSAATVPGGGIVTSSFVLGSMGLPIGAVAVIATIDRLLDGPRTAINITGDCVATSILTSRDARQQARKQAVLEGQPRSAQTHDIHAE